jgi:hypothetical protein
MLSSERPELQLTFPVSNMETDAIKTLVKEMPHEKCSLNCTSAHVRKTPMSEIDFALNGAQLLRQVEPVVKQAKAKGTAFHAVMPIEFLPPKNFMQKLAAKPNVVKVRIVEYGPDIGKVRDVKLCMQCSEADCAKNPACPSKAAARAYLFDMQNLKVGQ